MKYNSLGRCGMKVSMFSLGGWATFGDKVTDVKTARDIIHYAFDNGINFFDMADVYAVGEAERLMGKILKDFPRHRLVLSSKAYWPFSDDVNDRGLSRKHLMESVEKSLKRIGTDYLDLYFCHRFDEETPLEETARAMDDLIHQGKILYWGTSEWTGAQLEEVLRICDKRNLYPPQVEQPMYNLLERQKVEKDVGKVIQKHGLGLVTYSPLASGFLTGKYDDGIPEDSRMSRFDFLKEWLYKSENLDRMGEFKKLAAELGSQRTQLAIAWAAAQPAVSSVLLGATSLAQLKENMTALKIDITDEVNTKLREIFPVDQATPDKS
ncbi:MAG: aldo/keto reductase family protein [candidate division KSB1 bacterium]|nr:aldo/keto reductase family protein [candidate division KSB1 bacterium]